VEGIKFANLMKIFLVGFVTATTTVAIGLMKKIATAPVVAQPAILTISFTVNGRPRELLLCSKLNLFAISYYSD